MDDTFELTLITRRNPEIRQLDAGEPVFFEHRPGAEMYAVLSGRIDVVSYGKELEQVGPGGFVGEMALIDEGPRSAAALAAEKTTIAVIPRDMFLALVKEEPVFALHVMRVLARRLRRRD
ncbi:MAG TPA: cyclic nucleotide-binding domain-containing protein [Hyphomicrobium sp.]|nr:cyclic nucleotide-binding domain-containing protein [Hyphomicrobium sp.]